MQLFNLKTTLHCFETFDAFAQQFQLKESDLIITQSFLFDPFMKPLHLPCHFVMQEDFGSGEPTDGMIHAIESHLKGVSYSRVIGIGGGTVLDIAKLFVLKNLSDVTGTFKQTIPLEKDKELILVPTTCGTGSEVTAISIAWISSLQTKIGLSHPVLTPNHAVIIPELLKGLPFNFYMYSAIDALVHAVESYLSPKATRYTRLFSQEAIGTILDVFKNLVEKGAAYRMERLEDMLVASNMAGIAFGNAGCGAVHALSYPLGGQYHVPHGESNYLFFTEVLQLYYKKEPHGVISSLYHLLAKHVGEDPFSALDNLLGQLVPKKPLRTYGMRPEEVDSFSQIVLATQGRLLANNYTPLSLQEITAIYKNLY